MTFIKEPQPMQHIDFFPFSRFLSSLFCLFTILFGDPMQAQLVLNEGSNKNYSHLSDEDGDFEDWVELYNAGTTSIQLGGYTLTDQMQVPGKWPLPAIQLPPGGFLLLYCSGKNRYAFPPLTAVHQSLSFTPVSGWNTHNFSTPLVWDGQSALLLNVCSYNQNGYITNAVHRSSSTAFPSTVFSFQDYSDAACQHNQGTPSFTRPLLQFNGITIGSGNLQNSPYDYPAPYGNWYWSARHQLLFLPQELLAAGLQPGPITSLAFDVIQTDPVVYTYIDLHLGQVPVHQLSAQYLPLQGYKYHTNFKISGQGETVYLFDAAQQLVSSLSVNTGPGLDVSAGSIQDGGTNLGFFSSPTPGASNQTAASFQGYALSPTFSVPPGRYAAPFGLSLINPNFGGGTLYYTLDGQTPDTNSLVWTGQPIPIFQNTVVRVKAVVPGWMDSPVLSGSFLLQVQHSTPILAVAVDPDDIYGPQGIFDHPLEDKVKAAHADYLEATPGHPRVHSGRAAIRMDGGWGGSRTHPQRSFRISWNHGVLGDGPMLHSVHPDRPQRNLYSDLYLRNGSNQWLVLPWKDAVQVKLMMENQYGYYSAFQPISVYINGQYFGWYEGREKWNIEYFTTLEGAHPDSIDLLSLSAFYNYQLRAVEGSTAGFEQAVLAWQALDANDPTYWNQVQSHVDLPYYVDYIAAQTWMGNTDWPQNNIKIYRSNTTAGAWRYGLIDQELSLGPNGWTDCYFDHFDFMLQQDPANPHIGLWLKSMQNPTFRHYFLNRMADLMNSSWADARLIQVTDAVFNQSVLEMPAQYQRWGNPWDVPQQVNQLYANHLTFQQELLCRSAQVKSHAVQRFGLQGVTPITLDVWPPNAGRVEVHTLSPAAFPWQGDYFDGIPVPIRAVAAQGFVFSHWESNGLISDTLLPQWTGQVGAAPVGFRAIFKTDPLGAFTQDLSPEVRLFPNPTAEHFSLSFPPSTTNNVWHLTAIDGLGRTIATQTVMDMDGTFTWSCSEWPKGLYLIEGKHPALGTFRKKLVVQ